MALFDTTWYVSSVGWSAVTAWATGTAVAAGALKRQNTTPATNSERVFVCIVAGTTHATTEPTWTTTRGAKTTDNTVTWQECTGASAVNGDLTNTPSWTSIKNQAITLGQIIKRDNGASYQICSTAGTAGNGSEPSFSNTAGTTTADNTVTWTSLGVVGNFAAGAAPHARLANALTTNWAAAGNKVFVKSDHAESQSTSMSITGAGTVASPIEVYCHNASSYPPVSADITTGATVTSTSFLSISASGLYCVGIQFASGSGAASGNVMNIGQATAAWQRFDNCRFHINYTSGNGFGVCFGAHSNSAGSGQPSHVEWNNCVMKFATTQMTCAPIGVDFTWRGGSIDGTGSAPATFWSVAGDSVVGNANVFVEGVDHSSGGTTTVVSAGSSIFQGGTFTFKDCKLPSGFNIENTPSRTTGPRVDYIRCDNGATNYIHGRSHYAGAQSVETTIVRTGGATINGQAISWKFVSSANARWMTPFEAVPIQVANTRTGQDVTVTVYGIWGGGAVPNNDDIWMEVTYLGASGNPQGTIKSTTKATKLATGAALDSDSSTWGGSTTKFKMVATLTSPQPQMAGQISVRIKVGAASQTFYIDPKPVLS